MLPAESPVEPYDLRAHYFGIHRLFFAILGASTLLEAVRALRFPDPQAAALNVTASLLLGSMAAVRHPRYHAIGTCFAALLMAAFIVAETLRIS